MNGQAVTSATPPNHPPAGLPSVSLGEPREQGWFLNVR